MPSNIFATTGTNVSVIFIDKTNNNLATLVDASKLGIKVKEGKNQKTLLSSEEEQKIIDVFSSSQSVDDLSVKVSFEQIKEKNYSFSGGQYFEIKIEHVNITKDQFEVKLKMHRDNLKKHFDESKNLEDKILDDLDNLKL